MSSQNEWNDLSDEERALLEQLEEMLLDGDSVAHANGLLDGFVAHLVDTTPPVNERLQHQLRSHLVGTLDQQIEERKRMNADNRQHRFGIFTKRASRVLVPGGVLLLALLVTGIALALQASAALFELEGDASDDPEVSGDDWQNVHNGSDNADASVFIADGDAPGDSTYFSEGGSKDVNDISQWAHASQDVAPDKDELLDIFAAAYVDNSDLHLFFGADRFANNGDAEIGFWFFQDEVTLNNDGTFNGSHQSGDVLILSDFTQGGGVSTINVYRWAEGGSLELIDEGVDCAAAEAGSNVCATVNDTLVDAPWPYAAKFPDADNPAGLPAGSLYEGGANLSALLGEGNVGCFSSFMAETRSSQDVNAQLKDFALGGFEFCNLELGVVGSQQSKVGDPASYDITIENNGLVTLYLQSIEDTVLGDLSEAASAAGCDTLAPGATCQFDATYTVHAEDADPLANTLSVIYNSNADGSGDALSAEASSEVSLFQPGVTLNITADDTFTAGDEVTYHIDIENTSSDDSPNLVLDSLTSDVLGDLTTAASLADCGTLASGAICGFDVNYVVTQDSANALLVTVAVHYHPQGFPNDITSAGEHTATIAQPPVDTNEQAQETPTPEAEPSGTEVPTSVATATPESTEENVADEPQPTATDEPPVELEASEVEPVAVEEADEEETDIQDEDEAQLTVSGVGCSPGFWQGGRGRHLWNVPNDPGWLGDGMNPYVHDTQFNDVFAPHSVTESHTVYSFVRRGGGPIQARKAARNVVAGYLNASYGMDYPLSPQEVADLWAAAVNGETTFAEVHKTLGAFNELGCGID